MTTNDHGATDILDTAILKNLSPSEICEIETINEEKSNHNPLLLKLGGAQDQSYSKKLKTNWKKIAIKAPKTIRDQTITTIAELN